MVNKKYSLIERERRYLLPMQLVFDDSQLNYLDTTITKNNLEIHLQTASTKFDDENK